MKLHGGCLTNIGQIFDTKRQVNESFLCGYISKMAAFPLKNHAYIRLAEAWYTMARRVRQHIKHEGLKYQSKSSFRRFQEI